MAMVGFQATEMDAKLAPVNLGPYSFVWRQILRRWTTFYKTTFTRFQKYERGRRLKVKIHILFYGENSWTVTLRQTKFCALKDHGHTYKFYF
jgi:hypothetical protein